MMMRMLWVLMLNEVRLRVRRLSSVVALLALVAVSWGIIVDPATGRALLVVNQARVLYTSTALALGSAALAGLLFALAAFYLVRGRIAEDMQSGLGSVIGASPIGNATFLFGRWLGGVAYLAMLLAAFLCSMLVYHGLRGHGPIELLVYVQAYVLLLGPMVIFAISCAILFDSVALLMGKAGDVLYFLVWVMLVALVSQLEQGNHSAVSGSMALDFTGILTTTTIFQQQLHTSDVSIGASTFDPALTPFLMSPTVWSHPLVALRCTSMLLAMLPLLPAMVLFHRYSPDRVKLSASRPRRSPLALLNAALRPLAALAQPLFRLAAILPLWAGQVVADVALSLVSSPSAIFALAAALMASVLVKTAALGGVLVACVGFWGILVSDMSTRDVQADTLEMSGVVQGGAGRRYLRQFAAAVLLGIMFMGVIALRWSSIDPGRALALVAGIVCLAALASLMGRCSGSARTFGALFMFWLYIAIRVDNVPMLDMVGFAGAANLDSTLKLLFVALAAMLAGIGYNRLRSH